MSHPHVDRYASLKLVYGNDLIEFVRENKVLVVGAGGIGCELLKNLVLSGFENIEIIDLDTIDISNLNRQFLFRQRHVGESKAKIAKETALTFNPKCNIVAHHGNIKQSAYGLDFFKQFKLVINALDNVDARRHVNRLCLAANIPMLDGGTAGYLGQVKSYQKGFTECYECKGNRNTEKTYAVCTIRSNPSKMIHCVVWAKLLFDRLFGKISDSNEISTGFEEILKATEDFPQRVFDKVFVHDIRELSQMKNKEVWNTGKPPEPLTDEYLKILRQNNPNAEKRAGVKDQIIWTPDECVQILLKSLSSLKQRREQSSEPLSFDKDDEDALNLVTSASNLRAFNFHIPPSSRFDIKSMAGNIVPAIATTNAIIAGLLVCEAFKVMKSIHMNQGKESSVNHVTECLQTDCLAKTVVKGRKNTIILPVSMGPPNKKCFVCSSNSVTVFVNCDKMSLERFVQDVLQNKLALKEPSVLSNDDLIYECGEELEQDQIELIQKRQKEMLKDTGIVDGSELIVEDFSQDISWKVIVKHMPDIEVEEFYVEGDEPPKAATQENHIPSSSGVVNNLDNVVMNIDDGDDGCVCVTDQQEERKRLDERRNELKRKRAEVENNLSEDTNPLKEKKQEDEVILLDD
ncbi:hypothetical protein C9374_000600 [Naegleria lovaniensis]|uniref:SUMO-activating enzyme subunit n=1 Tax=Naegleria lovaniensis TaxID=51637 RepID=A0AA88KPA3_NAELO|nr:uncharacterized protein C9374_000600 [Naegleria lovaniensis]KAG2388436.1 hypothetical protein C9374_000600 [Naegleria lovaniensis]